MTMKKTGQLSTGAAIIIGLIVIFALLAWLVPSINKGVKTFFLPFGIDKEEKKEIKPTTLSQAELAFESFLMSYKNCKKHKSNDCICSEFDVTEIPGGYSIRLENLGGKGTNIEIYSRKQVREKGEAISDDNLCFYEYNKQTKDFSKNNADDVVIKAGYKEYIRYNKIQLFKFDNKNTCFFKVPYETKNFDELTSTKLKCNLKDKGVESTETGIISDLSHSSKGYPPANFQVKEGEDSKIMEKLKMFLLSNVGRIKTIKEPLRGMEKAEDRLRQRKDAFEEAYSNFDRNSDKKISDDIYSISIKSLQAEKKDSEINKDYFKIHYLKGSLQSKRLAEKIKLRLEELNDKLIFNEEEVETAEADEKHRFDFEVKVEENSEDNEGPVFLACINLYSNFRACKENALLPAVFIDVVEVVNKEGNHEIFTGHYRAIAEKIYEGTRDYLAEKGNI